MIKFSKKLWAFLIAIIIVILVILSWIYRYRTSEKTMIPNTDFSGEPNAKTETIEGDLLGIGSKQKIDITVGERKVKIEVFNKDKLVASNVFDGWLVRPTSQYSLIKIQQNKSREYLRWDQYPGPHQVETIILTTGGGIVRPILAADYENKMWYAPFWSIRDNTYIGDIDGDGVSEVVEYVDEYPPNTPRLVDPELEQISRREFPDDKEDDMWKIVSRENYGEGRGRKVIWNVYTMRNEDPLLFQKANKEDYKKLTINIIKAMKVVNQQVKGTTEVMSKYDLKQDSIDFNNFVRNFWTQGQPYYYSFDEIKDPILGDK